MSWLCQRFMALAVVACVQLTTLATADAKPAVTHLKLLSLIARAESLYVMASQAVGAGPASRNFFTIENAFQRDLNTQDGGEVSSPPWDGLVRLEQFDDFIFAAVTDYRCSARARAELRLARQLLDHATLDAKGRSQVDWMPNLDSVPECR